MTMRDLSELWINEGGEPVRRKPPTDAMIAEFARQTGLTLLPEHVTLLRHSNGGHPYLDLFEPEDGDEREQWSVNLFFHLDDDREEWGNLYKETAELRSFLWEEVLPFANTGGGEVFFLDMQTNPPIVAVWSPVDPDYYLELAPSFQAFIDGLKLNEEIAAMDAADDH